MVQNIADITAASWQLALNAPGGIVTGIADINQQIAIVIGTRKGQVPGRPLFGSDVHKNVDLPLPIAARKTKIDVVAALGIHIPSVTVKDVFTSLAAAAEGALLVSIVWEFSTGTGAGTAQVVL